MNENGAIPLEATPRFGYPTIHVEDALLESPWGEFLKTVADGKEYALKWRKGFGIVLLIAVPPFPYQAVNNKYSPEGLQISFCERLSEEETERIHFSEVFRNGDKYIIAAKSGYVMCVTGVGKTAEQARRKAYSLADKIVIPRMFFRNDIGLKFIERDQRLLKKWGYL